MVDQQIVRRGITDPQVLKAMGTVPRERFVSSEHTSQAYADHPLPIRVGQTISQPCVVARMAEALALSADSRVLDIGTGSGYAAAVLAQIAAEVFTIERHQILAGQAGKRFRELGYQNIHTRCGDGTLGWPEAAPFEGIAVAAGAPEPPPSLLRQLAIGGRLVIPVGDHHGGQDLLLIQRTSEDTFKQDSLGGVRFVPLVGEEAWSDQDA